MKKTDINKYREQNNIPNLYEYDGKTDIKAQVKETALALGKMVMSALKTFLIIVLIAGLIATSSIVVYMSSLTSDKLDYDLRASKVKLTSVVYVNDENGTPQEYQNLYNAEHRIWVDFDDIPDAMKNAVIAIEDKRFRDHNGVDWTRTISAVFNLLKGSDSYGGSTLTQQLIKNLTEESEVSLTRKIKEIFRALNFEKKYSKDEILEAYLNVVNFGSGCRGVQAAANLYFGKDIKDCSIAQCASIAGITQNPSAYTPLVYPENNKKRRETVIREMYNQNMITKEEYDQAMEESENMEFVGEVYDDEDDSQQVPVRNWYVEALYNDVVNDLSEKLDIGKTAAEEVVLTQGLKIYSAMDKNAQEAAEATIKDSSVMPADLNLDLGYVMMGFDGRILATLGCREEKTGDLWFDKANQARRQPGSIIKPIAVYAPAIDLGMYNYSSLIPDEPLRQVDVKGDGKLEDWPVNWYGGYKGTVTLQWAIEKSANAPAVQVLKALTPKKSFNFLTEKLKFTSLDSKYDENLAALATGGTNVGVTVREMTAAFQIFGNGGMYNKPFTYYYVLDRDGNVLLDNRDNVPTQAISSKTATIMNRLLRHVIDGAEGTGTAANISGWNIIGKTGTTTDDYDSWFIGESPYAVAGIWTGYDTPKTIKNTGAAIKIWRNIMSKYLSGKEVINYNYDSGVSAKSYCKTTGKLVKEGVCKDIATGYYAANNIPQVCDGSHSATVADQPSEAPSSSEKTDSLIPVPESSSVPSSDSSSSSSSDVSSSSSSSSSSEVR